MLTSSLLSSLQSVRHGFFTRQGGVSQSYFQSLNFTLTKGDTYENVKKNRDIAMTAFQTTSENLVCMKQVHGTETLFIDYPTGFLTPNQRMLEGDALVTTTSGLAIGILTADCVPILLSDSTETIIGAAHAGWRGALGGVVESVLGIMREKGAKNIVAAIGPCIRQHNYEVGLDVWEGVITKNPNNQAFFEKTNVSGKYLLDLPGLVKNILMCQGVSQVDLLSHDTYSDEAMFFSCRRATHRKEPTFGCQLSAIMIQKE